MGKEAVMTSLFRDIEKRVISIPLTFDEPWDFWHDTLGTLHDVIQDAVAYS